MSSPKAARRGEKKPVAKRSAGELLPAKKPAAKKPTSRGSAAKKPAATSPAAPALPVGEAFTERRREVLHAALRLIAEQGYAGASLRELARRLGLSQPSLYHYFRSKEELLQQVIEFCGSEILYGRVPQRFPQTLDDVPEFVREVVLSLYDEPAYPLFLRFLFAVAPMHPGAEAAARRLYGEAFEDGVRLLMAPIIAAGELTEDEAVALLRMLTASMALFLIEQRVLYGEPATSDEVRRYAAWVVRFARAALRGGALEGARAAAPGVDARG